MFVVAGQGDVPRLEDANEFRKLEFRWTLDAPIKADDIALAGLLDDKHVWLDPNWLRTQGAIYGPGWQVAFDEMAAFARTKGWTNPEGFLRAHITNCRNDPDCRE